MQFCLEAPDLVHLHGFFPGGLLLRHVNIIVHYLDLPSDLLIPWLEVTNRLGIGH